MLHQLIVQAARPGGEIVFGLLLLASIVSVAIISGRAWFLLRHRIDADLLARQLLPPLAVGDWPKARAIARRSTASACQVIAAGLTQADRGRAAVRAAMRSAKAHQRIRLEADLGILGTLGRSALLLGVLGTLLELMQAAREPAVAHAVAASVKAVPSFDACDVLGPAAAGLVVAIPALLASSFLKCRVRRTLRQVDALAQLLLLQVGSRRPRLVRPKPSVKSKAA